MEVPRGNNNMKKGFRNVFIAFGLLLTIQASGLYAETLPQYGDDMHLGVQTCSGSTCHGAIKPWQNSSVLQNEAITWKKHDHHARAFKTLGEERSQRIAKNLGIEDPQKDDTCLNCHANNVPKAKRAKNFTLSDGVTCEACHGGAEKWLGIHVSGVGGRKENIEAGQYPTEEPIARAKLCLSCHYGTKNKFLTHKIMGAGHPRLSFELDTYTATQPAHYRVDADYRQRKSWDNGVKTWAIGQAVAVEETLEALTDVKRNRQGIFPELVFFDCHACHHPMSNLRWERRDSVGLDPGIPKLNDANIVLLRVVTSVVDPELGKLIENEARALHQSSMKGGDATHDAANTLKQTLQGVVQKISSHSFTGNEMGKVLNAILEFGLHGEYVNYIAAEQATYSIGSVIEAMKDAGLLKDATIQKVKTAMDMAYEAVKYDEKYRPSDFVKAIESIKAAIEPELQLSKK